jgi:GNAT superfamily N-acetyltransferase
MRLQPVYHRRLVFITLPLARRFEAFGAELTRRCSREFLEIGGGIAAFTTPASPLTHAAGLGMNGPVRDDDLDRLEQWYRERSSPTAIEVCPLADAAFLQLLGRRGFVITETSNFLVRRLHALEDAPAAAVEVTEITDVPMWTRLLAQGFFEHDPLPGELEIGADLLRAEGMRAFIAMLDEQPAAGGALAIIDRIACLCADATLPPFRGRGAQLALIRQRLREAIHAECEFAIAETAPATISQRNYQRCGFEVAWTKLTFVSPARSY